MAKIKTLACVLTVLLAASCSKDKTPDRLAGTQWGTTIQTVPQITVLLSFTNDTRGVLSVTGADLLPIEFTYTYTKPNLVLRPTDPELAAEYPNGIKTTVHGNVMDFTEFFKDISQGHNIVLIKK
ncbi:MAG: hypothetical protein FWE30_05815 [Bacteroidales bacterium]|nr:hypothetical protein [Bacteroidales bacterium]